MKQFMRNRWFAALFGLAGFLMLCWCGPNSSAKDESPRRMPEDDRQVVREYLGRDVVGDAVASPVLPGGVNDILTLRDGIVWHMRVISGKDAGNDQLSSSASIHPSDGSREFRFDTGDGEGFLFTRLDAKGSLWCFASQDNQVGVISRYSPPQPIFLADLKPGETRHIASHVSVADLSQPQIETHSGNLEIDFTYVGAYRVKVPAGNFDAMLLKTHLKGHVGPASVDDSVYRFIARNGGLVAVVETDEVSAFLVYQDHTRMGKVLWKRCDGPRNHSEP
jgi:hypothetical protein